MRGPFFWQVLALLLFAGAAAGARVPNPSRAVPPSGNSLAASTKYSAAGDTTTPSTLKPGVTVTGTPLHSESALPTLPPDEFMNCERMLGVGILPPSLWQMEQCEFQLDREKNVVLRACVNLDGKTPTRRVVQACTESLDHNVVSIEERSFLFANRAQAYLALGYKQRALGDYDAAVTSARLLPANERFLVFASRADAYLSLGYAQRALADYNAAIKSAPHNAAMYYNRGVVLIALADYDAALQDCGTALKYDSKFVPALRQRAKIYAARGNLTGAFADYSEAIGLQPKTAALWSNRGQVDLGLHEYGNAIEDEAHAIALDPKLASAYYLRSVAFGDSGDRTEAVRDLRMAVGLDPSLATYVTIKGKSVVLRLPPL
jgi:tetratricopeptide (TPR) repeat protein